MAEKQKKNLIWGKFPIENNAAKKNESKFNKEDGVIYFYSGVDEESVLLFIQSLKREEVKSQMVGLQYSISPPPIKVHIHSYGGSVLAGFAARNAIQVSKVPIHTYIDGACASAATLMSLAGSKRYIGADAYILIHQFSAGRWGKFAELEDEFENMQQFMVQLKDTYAQDTNLKRKEITAILKHDLWWDAQTCLEKGLVDEILL